MHAHSGVRAREKIFVLKLDFAAERERERKRVASTHIDQFTASGCKKERYTHAVSEIGK
jgi:hypothetical protein